MKIFSIISFRYAFLIGTSLFFFSCSSETDIDTEENLESRNSLSYSSKDLLEISYTMDYVMNTEYEGTLTGADVAASTPISSKDNIKMIIRANGDIRLETEKLTTKNPILIKHHTLPNDMPEVKRTVYDRNTLSMFDKNGALISSVPGQSISLPFLAEDISKNLEHIDQADISNLLACIRSNVDIEKLQSLIDKPIKGTKVNQIKGTDLYTVRMPVPDRMGMVEPTEVVNIIDRKNNLYLGSRLYGKDNEILQCMMYRFDECDLKGFKQEVKSHLPSGIVTTMVTHAELENLVIRKL